jgi:glutamate dehydrogenase
MNKYLYLHVNYIFKLIGLGITRSATMTDITVWKKNLKELLIEKHPGTLGLQLAEKYCDAFSLYYMQETDENVAVIDIAYLETVSEQKPLQLNLYLIPVEGDGVRLKLFQLRQPISLTEIIPIFENMDLPAQQQHLFEIICKNQPTMWISKFILDNKEQVSETTIAAVKQQFHAVFINAYNNPSDNDILNRLVVHANLDLDEIKLLRAYKKYLRQIAFRFSQQYIAQSLTNHPQIAKTLIELFKYKFDPALEQTREALIAQSDLQLQEALNAVVILDEDKILRTYIELINATIRTNYYQHTNADSTRERLAFKFESKLITDMPLPAPLYEIFVYSSRFEGIHLRSAKVARGGIRWSDRHEDFRTEILGLMKTQIVKNSVIVPSGAKGGFVLKALPAQATRDIVQAEVASCYDLFIRSLLELTDNISNKQVIHPERTLCYDDDDPYLVVAADKGTATFSDRANGLSKEFKFWLSDAFASGGSAGYDHKKIGITARGAWESVKRHFRELNINLAETDITVVGIGDMSGDVFGNGLLYSHKIMLVAAFDHRDIFLDPNPDPAISFNERQRLFQLPYSSWQDYNKELISQGGGVYSRKLKSITLPPEVKQRLGIQKDSLTPNELITAILTAEVDLFWNGGIGTYVKASSESHADVNDKANDYIRINGCDLRTRVVGEGGNLGFTQLGRIEYALQGGLINTDFIDNSGGVDCSDYEVNLKILLNAEIEKGNLNEAQRNALLASMTEDVSHAVLQDNYTQAWSLSYAATYVLDNFNLYVDLIKDYEEKNILDRRLECIPDDKKLIDRKMSRIGLTRPELAVLLAYTKIYLKNELLKSDLLDEPYYADYLVRVVSEMHSEKYAKAMLDHVLRRELLATHISSRTVNDMGIFFISRLQVETGASIPDIVKAYTIVAHIFETRNLIKLIDSVGYKMPLQVQYEMFKHLKHLVTISTRWFLLANRIQKPIHEIVEHFSKNINTILDLIPDLMGGITKSYLDKLADQFVQAGLAPQSARRIAGSRAMYNALNIIEITSSEQTAIRLTAELYFAVGERFNLIWFRDQLNVLGIEGYWSSLSRITLRNQLDTLQKLLTTLIINKRRNHTDAHALITEWTHHHAHLLERWEHLQTLLKSQDTVEFSMFFVALVELTNLLQTGV